MVAPIHECLEDELEADRKTVGRIPDVLEQTEWQYNFTHHPLRHAQDDARPVYPIALYADGVRYTRAGQLGKIDSLINFTIHNLASGRRHLISVVAKRELCKCGCRGWCSMYVLMHFFKHCLVACAHGIRPNRRYDGGPLPDGHPNLELGNQRMAARYLLVEIKGDWMEHCSTFGFMNWAAVHRPCVFCSCKKSELAWILRFAAGPTPS